MAYHNEPRFDAEVRYNGQQKRATCFAALLQLNEFNSDVVRFASH